MQQRQHGATQETAAAKAGISVRSGRRIEKSGTPRTNADRNWRTREDPLDAVWNTELVLLLEREPTLTGVTLLEYLEEHYPEHYDQRILRTLKDCSARLSPRSISLSTKQSALTGWSLAIF